MEIEDDSNDSCHGNLQDLRLTTYIFYTHVEVKEIFYKTDWISIRHYGAN